MQLDSTNEHRKFTFVLSSIFASWKENAWLIRFSAYLTVTHLVANLIVLAFLLVSVASIGPCKPGRPRCPKLLLPKSVWNVLYAIILSAQLCESNDHPARIRCTDRGDPVADLSLVVLSYLFYLQDHSRRAYIPEISSRGLSAPPSQKPDHKHLLSNPEGYSTVELGPVESRTTTRSLSTPEPGAGYGGGMRTYEEAEENEKARLRREMENEETQVNMSFPIPSSSETPILTPLGLQWRDGDLPPYAS